MSIRLSRLFGMDLYTDEGEYKGKIHDIIINLEKGKLEQISLEPLKARSRQEAIKLLKEKAIPYEQVVAVKDIIIISKKKYKAEEY